MSPRNEVNSGAILKRKTPGQPAVSDLLSNRSVFLAMIDPDTVNQSAELQSCGSMAAAVKTFKPKKRFNIKVIDRLMSNNESESTPHVEECEMNYGETVPENAVYDVSAENLIGKVRLAGALDEVDELDKHPLLKLRLQSMVLADIAGKLGGGNAARIVGGDRKALLAWLKIQSEAVNKILEEDRNRRVVTAATEGGDRA